MTTFGFIGGNIGGGEMLIVLVVFLLLFGAKKLPEMARGLGKSLEEFRRAARDVKDEVMKAGTEVTRELEAEPPTPVYPATPAPELPAAGTTEPPIDVEVEPSTDYHPPTDAPESSDLPVDRAIEETALAAASLEQQYGGETMAPTAAVAAEAEAPVTTAAVDDGSVPVESESGPPAAEPPGDIPPEKPA